jgi:hypothetical protein
MFYDNCVKKVSSKYIRVCDEHMSCEEQGAMQHRFVVPKNTAP